MMVATFHKTLTLPNDTRWLHAGRVFHAYSRSSALRHAMADDVVFACDQIVQTGLKTTAEIIYIQGNLWRMKAAYFFNIRILRQT